MKIIANGIGLHLLERGSGEVALVFLHYWGGTARTWNEVLDALPPTVRAIALDARGWGQSDRPEEGYDIATLADDVEAAIRILGLARYILVGHSMGGKVAQLLASRRPEGLESLVLVAPSPAQGKSLTTEERAAMAGAYDNAEGAAWTVDNVLSATPLSEDVRSRVIADSVGGARSARKFWPEFGIAEDVSANLDRIAVPVLVIGGANDKVDGVEMLKTVVVKGLPDAAMTVIPRIGHLLPLEAPGEVADLIVAFAGI